MLPRHGSTVLLRSRPVKLRIYQVRFDKGSYLEDVGRLKWRYGSGVKQALDSSCSQGTDATNPTVVALNALVVNYSQLRDLLTIQQNNVTTSPYCVPDVLEQAQVRVKYTSCQSWVVDLGATEWYRPCILQGQSSEVLER